MLPDQVGAFLGLDFDDINAVKLLSADISKYKIEGAILSRENMFVP